MDMDPRLQLSDLTDYQYHSSLAQQYHTYNANDPTTNNVVNYFQPIPQDDTRPSALRSSQSMPSQAQAQAQAHSSATAGQPQPHEYGLQALYQRTSIPEASRGFNAGSREASLASRLSVGNGMRNQARAALPGQNVNSSGTTNASSQIPEKAGPVKDPTTFVPPHLLAPMKPNPPSLKQWREKFFNIDEPLLLTSEQYLTYFPHVDNVYSHRSTQKYKRKPFVSHYWDCRLKGRPTGTPMNKGRKADGPAVDKEPKKRKRKVRERDLCDVKIKVTEYFGVEELEALKKLGYGGVEPNGENEPGELNFALDGQVNRNDVNDPTFGVLEPTQNYPPGHPGAGGKKWYLVQRVSGVDKDGEEEQDRNLDHKHTLEDSDRIKKNSVQRWLLAQAKEKKKAARAESQTGQSKDGSDNDDAGGVTVEPPPSRLHATGTALQTLHSHNEPTNNHLAFYACSYCPFSQRVWIALELSGIPYQYIEVTEKNLAWAENSLGFRATYPELADINPEGKIPCIKHNNFAVWESAIMMEYLEDLSLGHSLFAPAIGSAQLKAHSRLWVDFIDRRILPIFYALLLLPDMENTSGNGTRDTQSGGGDLAQREGHQPQQQHQSRYTYMPNQNQCNPSSLPPDIVTASGYRNPQTTLRAQALISTLHTSITTLVNASHRTGPFFLGPTLSYVDIAFAPWIIRLSRVLSYYRGFPRPEVGTRWQSWCDAIENNEIVKRTTSNDINYREIYGGVVGNGDGSQGWQYDEQGRVDWEDARTRNMVFPEMKFAKRIVETEGFGLGGDVWGRIVDGEGP